MKKKIFLALVCAAIMVSSCGKEKQQENKAQGKETEVSRQEKEQKSDGKESRNINIPESYEGEYENVVFQTKVHVAQEVKEKGLHKAAATLQKMDKDKVYQQLFQGIEVQEENTSNFEANDGSNLTEYYYQGKEGENLDITSRSIRYGTSFYNYVFNCVDLSEGGNIDSYGQDTDFDFASQEEALKDISGQLEQMGIHLGAIEYQVYALDYQTLQKNEYAMDMDGKEDTSIYKDNWSEEDNCYYFFIRQKVENVPEYHPYSDLFKDPSKENAPIKVVYSKNGIESLEIERIYQFEERPDDTVELMDFEQITEAVSYKFNQLLTTASYNVKAATLYYMTENAGNGTYQMFPIWIFDVEEVVKEDGKEVKNPLLVFVNAQSGEEIVMEDKY